MHGSSSSAGAQLLLELRRSERGLLSSGGEGRAMARRLGRRAASASLPSAKPPRSDHLWTDDSEPAPLLDPDPGQSVHPLPQPLPQHLSALRAGLECAEGRVRPPVLRAMSPRSQRRALQLPPPDAFELAQLDQLDELPGGEVFLGLSRAADRMRAREQRGRVPSEPRPQSERGPAKERGAAEVEPSSSRALFARAERVRQHGAAMQGRLAGLGLGPREMGPVHALVAGVYDELGVDLHASFNRERTLGRALAVLAVFWARARLWRAWERVRAQTTLARVARRARAVLDVQRLARGFLARRHRRCLLRNLWLQRGAQRARNARRGLLLLGAAVRAVLACRGMLARARDGIARRRRAAAATVQRCWRAAEGRARRRALARARSRGAAAAGAIQRCFRGRLARRKVPLRLWCRRRSRKRRRLCCAGCGRCGGASWRACWRRRRGWARTGAGCGGAALRCCWCARTERPRCDAGCA